MSKFEDIDNTHDVIQTVKLSLQEMLLSISLYHNFNTPRSLEACVIHMQAAWQQAFLAKAVKMNIPVTSSTGYHIGFRDLLYWQSGYCYEKECLYQPGKRQSENFIRLLENKSEHGYHQKANCRNTITHDDKFDGMYLNIELMRQLRNKYEHSPYAESTDASSDLSEYLCANIINYGCYLNEEFPEDVKDSQIQHLLSHLRLPIFASGISDMFSLRSKKSKPTATNTFVSDFLRKNKNRIGESTRETLLMSVSLAQDNAPSAEDIDAKKYRYSADAICQKIKEVYLGFSITSQEVSRIAASRGFKASGGTDKIINEAKKEKQDINEESNLDYCKIFNKDYGYTQLFLDFILENPHELKRQLYDRGLK